MTGFLVIEHAAVGMSIQDIGRCGGMGLGISKGGAADKKAFLEGAAILGNSIHAAAIELAVMGGAFRFEGSTRIALTGALMSATLDGAAIESGSSHFVASGSTLRVAAAVEGVYGYLHVAGGLETKVELGGRGRHMIAGLGGDILDGDRIPVGKDPEPNATPLRLPPGPAQDGRIRVMPGPQTDLFPDNVRQAFEDSVFTRSTRGNRQGVRLDHDGAPFATSGQLHLVSDFITEGDIQMTGDGTPFVLLADCQTIGGYPRIGTVVPTDLPRIAQAQPGSTLRFSFVSPEDAEALWVSDEDFYKSRLKSLQPRARDPREMSDLLSYEMISRPILE